MAGSETAAQTPAGVLDGLRVVELGDDLAAPVVGMVLAEQGAEVLRVVQPGARERQPVLGALVARGKVEIRIDPQAAEGRATLRRLLEQADVVVDNLPPGGLRRWGVSFDELRAGPNPGLVSCSLPPFRSGDPRGALPGYEAVVGLLGFAYEKPLGPPRYHEFPLGSIIAALFGANGVVAALIARERTGRGQHVDSSLYGATLFSQILTVLMKIGVPRGFLPLKMVGTPFMGSWLCGDGRYIYLHITLPAHNARILEILEQEGYRDDVARVREVLSAETMRDPSQVKSIPEAKKIKALYEQIFLTRSADEWERVLGGELCCIKVRTVQEWVQDSIGAGMSDACVIDDPVFGELLAPGPAVTVPELPPRLVARSRAGAALGEVLARWEATPRPELGELPPGPEPDLRHPLEGIRVADLSRVIAGPCAARILAEFGADVVSIQSPTRLDWALSFHLVFNAGKRSVTLDFRSDEGKRRLWALLDDLKPHAFIQNYRHLDVARAAGVHPDVVRERFPGIVYTHLNAYGNQGVWRDRPGFEQVVQAVSGIQVSYAGPGAPPKLLPTPVIDIGSGLMGALATMLGLYRQRREGEGLFATTHLTRMAVLFQLGAVASFQRDGALQRAQKAGHPALWDPDEVIIAGLIRARDGWACVAGPRKDVRLWLRHSGLADPSRPIPDDPFGAVGHRSWLRSVDRWRRCAVEAGVGDRVAVVKAPRLRSLPADLPSLDPSPRPLVRRRPFPGCSSELTFVHCPVGLSRTPLVDVSPAPMRGQHTRAELGRVGVKLPEGAGVIAYPENKPLLIWLSTVVRWGYFAWRSGNI